MKRITRSFKQSKNFRTLPSMIILGILPSLNNSYTFLVQFPATRICTIIKSSSGAEVSVNGCHWKMEASVIFRGFYRLEMIFKCLIPFYSYRTILGFKFKEWLVGISLEFDSFWDHEHLKNMKNWYLICSIFNLWILQK